MAVAEEALFVMRPIMLQGTSSDAGKTTLVAGLCRLFANRGFRVAPFKSQNMALNSFVTRDGGEIARATAMQAAGARQEPVVHMNPLLLKPKADDVAQLIVHGKAHSDVRARDYFLSDTLQSLKLEAIRASIEYLNIHYDLVIAEGAGSCAEPNLRRLDVVNMGLAHLLDAKVYVVVDINKGGAFADILGSLEVMRLTEPRDIQRIEGFLINKFRGDRDVLEPAIEFTERHSRKRIIGVLPYLHGLTLEEEDRVREFRPEHLEIDIAIIYLPHISNANDFDFLAEEPNVQVRYVRSAETMGVPDAVIIPGTKNTTWDLDYLHRTGVERRLRELAESIPVIGICGGYEMLGRKLHDPERSESEFGTMDGLGLLDIEVDFEPEKTLARRVYTPTLANFLAGAGLVEGYEIHMGRIHYGNAEPAYLHPAGPDGAVHPSRPILGTFIHDIFSNPQFTRAFVNMLREEKGLAPLSGPLPLARDRMEGSYENLAAMLAEYAKF
jgi:adenosylcobyric acid synthase